MQIIKDLFLDILSFIKSYFFRIKRICEWIPVLWKTFDWDFDYSLEIFKYSLERLEKGLKEGWAIHNKKHLKALKTCIFLLNRIIKDNYLMENIYCLDVSNNLPFAEEICGKFIWIAPGRGIEKLKILNNKEFLDYHILAEKQKKEDKKLLFSLLLKYGNSWWD